MKKIISSSTFGIITRDLTQPVSMMSEQIDANQSSSRSQSISHMVISDLDLEVEASASLPRTKASPQLNRWSRARLIRSGRKSFMPVYHSSFNFTETNTERESPPASSRSSSCSEEELTGKSIYMVSDGTGWTAEQSVKTALGQFEHCLLDRGCPVNTHLFSGVNDVERLVKIIKQAAKEGGILIYTLADPSMAESANQACKIWKVPSTDILSPITEAISSHLGVTPSGIPRGAPGRNTHLSDDYFRLIEAIEFTIKQDDGALPENLHKAEIILTGVSRTGKTPLSTYLAHKGYKIANVPIVMGIELPKAMFEVDPRKVFGLTINPNALRSIRSERAKNLGFSDEIKSNYSEIDYVKKDLEYARSIYAQNPAWPVLDITAMAIEETAAVILGLYHDRRGKCSLSRISKQYLV